MRGPGKSGFRSGVSALSVWVLLSMGGCSGSGRVEVLRPSGEGVRYSSAMVTEEGSLESVPEGIRRDFRATLDRYIYDRGPFSQGPELRIVYAITGYRPPKEEIGPEGNRERISGFVTATVRFFNFLEKEVGSIRASWDTGERGTLDEAVERCARQVASYAKKKFWNVGEGPVEDRPTKEDKQKSRWKPVDGVAR